MEHFARQDQTFKENLVLKNPPLFHHHTRTSKYQVPPSFLCIVRLFKNIGARSLKLFEGVGVIGGSIFNLFLEVC